MKDETKRTTLRIPISIKECLEKESRDMGVSLNALIAHILWDYLKKRKNET